MEMQQLHYFVSVYKSKSIARSADECHISAQGISISIHRLEDELGEKLFERTSKGLIPTVYADFLFVRAQRILASKNECLEFFRKNRTPEKLCRLSLAQGTTEEFVGAVLKKYQQAFPEVHLDIHEGTDGKCLDDILYGSTELAVVGGPLDSSAFDIVELHNVRYALITTHDDPMAQRESVHISDLRSLPIAILGKENSTNALLMSLCEREGFEPTVFCVPQYILSLFTLVQNGLCAGIVTESLAHRMAIPEIAIVPIIAPEYSFTISLIKNKGAELSKPADDLWNMMIDHKLLKN